MQRGRWWRETTRLRLTLLAIALGLTAAYVLLAPTLAGWFGPRMAPLLRPAFAMALLAGLMLAAGNALAILHRRHDKTGD